jgi:UDP-GlcNAc:undecaprenyl-phosphate GlcNAc-1-phosphate transferase
VATGLTDRQAVLALYAAAAVSGLIAIYTARFGFAESAAAVVLCAVGLGMLGVFLGRVGVYPESEAPPTDAAQLGALWQSAYWRQAGAFGLDLLLVALAYYTAYRLRFEQTFALEEPVIVQSLPIVIACKMAAFAVLGTYQGLWRYTSLRDLVRLAQGVSLGTVLSVLAILAVYRFQNYSRALFVVDWLLLLIFAGGSRVLVRLLAERLRPRPSNQRPVLIYGAGDGGVMVLRELRTNPALGREAVGFVDDDPGKARTEIQGLRVVGSQPQLEDLLQATPVAEVIVSSTKIAPERVAELKAVCERHGVVVVRSVMRFE